MHYFFFGKNVLCGRIISVQNKLKCYLKCRILTCLNTPKVFDTVIDTFKLKKKLALSKLEFHC